jgi:hypothetical protein
MLLFRLLGGIMGTGGGEPALAIVDVVSPESLSWIDGMTFLHLNNLLDTIVLAPIFILLFIVGAILLIISGFLK